MPRADARKVQDTDGVWGTVVSGSPHLFSNATQVVVQTESGQQFVVPTALLVPQPDGSYALPRRLAELEHAGSEPRVHQDESKSGACAGRRAGGPEAGRRDRQGPRTGVVHERRPSSMNPWYATTSPSRACRWSAWWRVPYPCVKIATIVPSWKRCWWWRSGGCCGKRSISASDAPRRTSHNRSRYPAKTCRFERMLIKLMNIHEGDVVWQDTGRTL